MIMQDTNVASEVMKTRPAQAIIAWLNGLGSERLCVFVSAIGETDHGLRILRDGQRRSGLRERFVVLAFDERARAYDESAARIYGERMGDSKGFGLPVSVPD